MSKRERISDQAIETFLASHPKWESVGGALVKTFAFEEYSAGICFVVRVGFASEKWDHHPDMHVSFCKVKVALWTHDAGGITGLDTEMADLCDRLHRGQVLVDLLEHLGGAGVPLDPARDRESCLPHLEEALTHPSFANEQKPGRRADNQRLEFLGDAVLGLLASELLMERFPAAKEGELSLMRSLLVNTEALAAWARLISLGAALRLGRGAAGERERDNVLADAVEAVVGAVYLDLGIEAARKLSAAIVGAPLARLETVSAVGRDAKSELQEQVQAEGGPSPRYRVVGVEGPDHRRAFVVVVEVDGEVLGEGRGRSKKLAEQAAARAAIDARTQARSNPEGAPSNEVPVNEVPVQDGVLCPDGDPQ